MRRKRTTSRDERGERRGSFRETEPKWKAEAKTAHAEEKKNRRVLAASEPNREIREAGLPVSGSTGSTWLFNWEGGLESLLELDGSSVPHCNRLPSCFSQSMLLQLTVTPPRK